MKKSDKKRRGVFIPDEFFKLDLTYAEILILAIYKYYTEEGELKCSVYTNQNIADIINANVKTVERAKKRFKKLGYIRTDGGIKTYYLGINKEHDVSGDLDNLSVGMDNLSVGTDNLSVADTDNLSPHNKEEKRIKKEIIKNKKRVNKEENKEEMKSELKEKQTVFDRMIPFMDQETKEHIDYIRERYKEQIEKINQIEELVEEDDITESYLKGQARMFKDMLYQDDKIVYKKVLPKEEKEVNENDYFDL